MVRNHSLGSVVETFLKAHPERRRSKAEIEDLMMKDEELDDQVDEMVQTVVKLKAKGKKKLALGTPRLHHRPFKDRWAHAWCLCLQTRA